MKHYLSAWQTVAMILGLMVHGAVFAADFTDQKGKAHKIEVKGTQAILIGMNQPAPDGVYRGKDGKAITVKNGRVAQGAVSPRDAIKPQPATGVIAPIDHKGDVAHKGAVKAVK